MGVFLDFGNLNHYLELRNTKIKLFDRNKELKIMKITPLHDRVLIKRLEENTRTAGGIIIPDTAKEKPSEGLVEAVGNGFRAEDGKIVPMSVKAGDKVLFGKWSGTEVKINGEERLIIKESEILGIIEE